MKLELESNESISADIETRPSLHVRSVSAQEVSTRREVNSIVLVDSNGSTGELS
jgi:hypothetical protein